MKKKKKKTVAIEEDVPAPAAETTPTLPAAAVEEESTPAPEEAPSGVATPVEAEKPAEDAGDLFADLKKKKKKKKEIPLDLETAGAGETSTTVDGLDVPMKKKKSKKQATDFAKELDEMDAENDEDAAVEIDGDLGDDVFGQSREGGSAEPGNEAWVVEGRDPTYPELLTRFFTLLHAHNPELAGEKRRYTIVPPQVAREGTKKTVFANISDICRRMHRQPEHVIQFIYSELGTSGSVDGAQRLVMKGRYNNKQIETVLRKYIVEYVTCKMCKSPDTLLGKENRLYFMTCEACGSKRSVSAIKTGFQAQVGKRSKTKAA
ncbi:translation initiation factor 2 subunit 2, partial [Tremellales sp. Uapishka_1]